MRPVAADVASSVCVSVCMSVVHNRELYETAKPFAMPYGDRTPVGPRNRVIDGGSDPPKRQTQFWGHLPLYFNAFYTHTHTHTHARTHARTHTHTFNGPLSRTTPVSRYQKGETSLDFTAARDSEWQWHQLGICKSAPHSRQITTPAPRHSVFAVRMPFLPPNQRRQSTEGNVF